jgi:hypothetical protein
MGDAELEVDTAAAMLLSRIRGVFTSRTKVECAMIECQWKDRFEGGATMATL